VALLIGKALAYPNPFNPEVNIAFSLAAPAKVNVDIFNIRGQKVRSLHNGTLPGGTHSLHWNGKDSSGTAVSSGLYFARISNARHQQVLKLMLMK